MVLGALSDKDPSNHSSTWDAILSFAKAYPQAWDHINMAKAFLPRLWALLRHACYGSAESSLAAVLPLITLLPKVHRLLNHAGNWYPGMCEPWTCRLVETIAV